MRPGEILLLLADSLAFVSLTVPLSPRASWLRSLPPVALLVAAAQLAVEGLRWQLVPAYALAALFFLVWLWQTLRPGHVLTGRAGTDRLILVLAFVLAILGLLVSVGLPLVFPVFRFPTPTGRFGVGTTTYHWVDTDRREVFSDDPNERRELMVQVWYPTKKGPKAPRAAYIANADKVTPALARLLRAPGFTFDELRYVRTNAVASAPISDEQTGYPVLVFLEGLDGFRQMNTYQVEELVSHGYVVVGIDQPYSADMVVYPDGRQVAGWTKPRLDPFIQQSIDPTRTAPVLHGRSYAAGLVPYLATDASFVLERLALLNKADPNSVLRGRVDVNRAGVFGISLGGIVAGEAARSDPRFRACLVMDAPIPASVVRAGLRQPSMGITRDERTMLLEHWTRKDVTQTRSTMRALFERSAGRGYFVDVPGMFHLNMTDVPLWSPLFSRLGVVGPIEGQRAHDIVNAYSLAFFDRHLKGKASPLLDGTSRPFREVRFEARR
jgi:predicted dienelactone hydrolase